MGSEIVGADMMEETLSNYYVTKAFQLWSEQYERSCKGVLVDVLTWQFVSRSLTFVSTHAPGSGVIALATLGLDACSFSHVGCAHKNCRPKTGSTSRLFERFVLRG